MGILDPMSALGVRKTTTKKANTTQQTSPKTTTGAAGAAAFGLLGKAADSSKATQPATTNASSSANTVSNATTTPTTNNATSSYSQSLFDYFKEKNEKARQTSLDAILAKLKMGEQQYNANMDDITDQYQALRNQSEVERYKSQRSMREALANRGQLDSGFGRQEQLLMDTQYGNAINSLNTQEAKAKGEVQNLIAQLRAEAELEKAEIENQYNTAIENFKTQMGA